MGAGTEGVPVAGLYAMLLGSAVLSGIGDILIFQWAKGQSVWGLLSGIAIWIVSLVLLAYLFRWSTLPFSLVVVLLVVIHLLIDVVWDVTVLGSRLSVWQWLGVVLTGAAVILLQIGQRHAAPGT
jgi:drug/metabolite transporter (DMT)-like permease